MTAITKLEARYDANRKMGNVVAIGSQGEVLGAFAMSRSIARNFNAAELAPDHWADLFPTPLSANAYGVLAATREFAPDAPVVVVDRAAWGRI